MVEAAASHDALNKNDEPGIKTSCDPDTCSISTTTVACTKGSRASSQISLPGLDWDSQVSLFFSFSQFRKTRVTIYKSKVFSLDPSTSKDHIFFQYMSKS